MATAAAGAAGGGAGADGAGGAVGALEAAGEVPPGAAVDAAGEAAAGAGVTGGTGSARCTGAALLPVSFGGSTLAASELPSPEGLAATGLPPASPADPAGGLFLLCRLGLCGLVLGRIGLGRVGLASLRFGVIGLGIIGFGIVGLGGLGFAGLGRGRTHAGLFVDDRPAPLAQPLPGRCLRAIAAVLIGLLGRSLGFRGLRGVRTLARPLQPPGVAAPVSRLGLRGKSIGIRLAARRRFCCLARRLDPATVSVSQFRLAGPCFRFRTLVRPGLAAAIARIGRPVGDQIGAEQRGHVAAGRVVLTQETRQRSGRHGLQQPARALVAGGAGPCENLGRAFAGFEILRLRTRRGRRETADQKHHRR